MEILTLSWRQLAICFLPVAFVILLMWRWNQGYTRALYAVLRMLLQLALIGYVLIFIFQAKSGFVIAGVLSVMLVAASIIALNTTDIPKKHLLAASFSSVLIGAGTVLLLITQGVLLLEPWYQPSYMIPLAGMIFSASMTNISLALERLQSELKNGVPLQQARDVAFRVSMIPIVNSFLAVGLISLPGMMTGQILSGVSPLVAARYQIMVMCMIFGAGGLSTALFLVQIYRDKKLLAYLGSTGPIRDPI